MSKPKNNRDHMSRVAGLGCLICEMPAEVHHCFTSMGCKKDDFKTIPLCPKHHRTGGYGVAFHEGKHVWQDLHGSEMELFDKTIEMLNE